MRRGKWKYIRDEKKASLYGLSIDGREQANFAEAEPKRLAGIRPQFDHRARGKLQYKKEN
jgi:hypothetical protein